MAWRCRFLTARQSQHDSVVPDALVDFHTGSVFTTLEGCLDKIVDALLRGNPFGDSAESENRKKFEAFLDRVRALRDGKVFPFTVIM